ncbi:hypothetical protein CU098_013573, partial [Rhizopus stolonifer]
TVDENFLQFDLHKSIHLLEVKEMFDPKGDGFCGFRAAAHILYGNQAHYTLVKQNMIAALDLNRSTYENFLGMDINDIRSTITCGIDRTFDQIKRSDEGLSQQHDSPFDIFAIKSPKKTDEQAQSNSHTKYKWL